MANSEFEKKFTSSTKTHGVYLVLRDQQWHCRECEYRHLNITQIAGGSGIQGLQRGTANRPGMSIKSANHLCKKCNRQTRQDKWDGQFVSAVQGSSMPTQFVERAVRLLGGRDIIERTKRPTNQLTLDHKLPRIRWDDKASKEQTNYSNMTDGQIKSYFQLLKKSNGSVSHNLLKSRACEKCYKTGQRGKPFNIDFFYSGSTKWQPQSKHDPQGCIGCGWFDFDKWREELNKTIKRPPMT